jgi:hypothetical protein
METLNMLADKVDGFFLGTDYDHFSGWHGCSTDYWESELYNSANYL